MDNLELKVALGGIALELEDVNSLEGLKKCFGDLIDALAESVDEETPVEEE